MIIFDLDGTLADCEHRRHFIDPEAEYELTKDDYKNGFNASYIKDSALTRGKCGTFKNNEIKNWKPDWKSFHEACIYDSPIQPAIQQWDNQIGLGMMNEHQIWSGRCESVREQTEKWLQHNLLCFFPCQLKMRPIGDNIPDDQLKEKWLDEAVAGGKIVEYVFDYRPKVVRMWRRRGIFVFDCNQSGKEF